MILGAIHYSYLFIGQSIGALVYPMITFASPTLAANWFENSKRVLATSIAVSFILTGYVQTFGFTELLFSSELHTKDHFRHSICIIYTIKAAISILVALLTVFTLKSRPERPPSEVAITYRDNDILGTIRLLCTNKEFMLLSISHVLYYIMFISLYLNATEIFTIYEFSSSKIQHLELANICSGLTGSVVLGIFLHKTKLYKTAHVLSGVFCLIGCVLLYIGLNHSYTFTLVVYAYLGFVGFPVVTI